MPQLEGFETMTEVIRTYRTFSRADLSFLYPDESMAANIRKSVIDICSSCVKEGHYVIGLEQYRLKSSGYSFDTTYYLELGIYVRRFKQSLTSDELYHYSNRATKKILFEMGQEKD